MINARITLTVAALVMTVCARPHATAEKSARSTSAADSLRGAWRLVSLDEPGADGAIHHVADAKGSLIYTADGRMSVQVMYANAPTAPSASPVQYAEGGYEGSFGHYDVNDAAHIVTHHLEGANVRALVGKDLPRSYRFENRRLVIRSTRSDEHWSVTWERP